MLPAAIAKSSKDGRDKMAQDQDESIPSLINPVVEEFDMTEVAAEVNEADADLTEGAGFVELTPPGEVVEPTDEPDSPEPTDDADVPEASSEEVAEVEDEQPDEPATDESGDVAPSDEPEPEPEPKAVDGTPNKALQKLQQKQATLEREINDRFDQMMEALQAQATPAPPQSGQDEQPPAGAVDAEASEKASGELEAALAELEELSKDGDEFDDLTKADLSRVTASLMKAFKAVGSTPAPAAAPPIEGLDEIRQFVQAQQAKQAADAGWARFEAENGYDGRPLWQEALEEAAELYSDPKDSDRRVELAERYFDRKVEARQAAPASEAKPKPEPKAPAPKGKTVKPASSKPRTSAKGTSTTPPGARGAGQGKTAGGLPPIFAP